MQAIVCRDFSVPPRLETLPDPHPEPGEVLIDAAACGITFVDGLIVSGKYQLKPTLPHIPGFEVAGTIAALGEGVPHFNVGDRVYATTGLEGGGYASKVVVASTQVFPLPDTMTFGQGATFVQSYCTAYFSLVYRMTLRPGQTLLVLGASGGVGRAAVDIGKALGARVIAAASSQDRLDACRELAPDGYINYSTEDLKTQARALSDGGVDAVYDPIGGDLADAALRSLGHDGTFLVIGFAGGIPSLPANQILLRNRRVVGVEWGGWRAAYPETQTEMMNAMTALLAEGQLRPQEPAVFPLGDAVDVLDALNNRQVVGKVALIPDRSEG